jgi:hypothetical protein
MIKMSASDDDFVIGIPTVIVRRRVYDEKAKRQRKECNRQLCQL